MNEPVTSHNPQDVTPGSNRETLDRDYWLEKLSGQLVKSFFPYDGDPDSRKSLSRTMKTIGFQLDENLYALLLKISNKSNVRLHILLTAAWMILLHRYTGNTDMIVGAPTTRQEVEKEGELINTVLALRCQVSETMTVKDLLLQVGQTLLEADKHQNYPIDTLVYKLNVQVQESRTDFPVFDFSCLLDEIHDKNYLNHIRQNMIAQFRQTPSAMEGIIEYNEQLYREETVRRIAGHFTTLLGNALADVNRRIPDVEFLTPAERKQLLEDFNHNRAEFSRDKSVHAWVEHYANQTPHGIAVTCQRKEYSYEQVNRLANRLARTLKEKGITIDHTAGILMERSPLMMISILAVWKAGGAYIPLDTDYPLQRLTGILNDSQTRVLIANPDELDQELVSKLKKSYDGSIIEVHRSDLDLPRPFTLLHDNESEDNKFNTNPAVELPMPSLAYVIYTSGSTGKPKGAMVEHIGMMNHMQAKINTLSINATSVIAQNASHTFDISVWQFFAALLGGGKTVIYPETMVLDPTRLIDSMKIDLLTILEVVPSYLSVLLDTFDHIADTAIPSLQFLLVTGEEVKPHLVDRWFSRFSHIPMVNAYGPTEASDDITHHIMREKCAPGTQRIPIGKSIQNLNIYIVDQYQKLCPVGVSGEIWVSGVGVGRGYLQDEERTRQAFMEDPFAPQPGIRLYKTGDLGRWRPDGSIDFFGRIDFQVKIRGFRIELGEIENTLLKYPSINEAVVLDREDSDKKKYLCAYIVGSGDFNRSRDLPSLKEHLSRLLPDYMIPAHFVALDKMPLTPNGKIDRKALPQPDTTPRDILFLSAETMNALTRDPAQTSFDAGKTGTGQPALPKTKTASLPPPDPSHTLLEEYAGLGTYSAKTGQQYYPLSFKQKMFYYLEKTYFSDSSNHLFFNVTYPYSLDPGILEEAINKVLKKNSVLRTRIVELSIGSSIQAASYIAPYKPYMLEIFDFSIPGQANPDKERYDNWILETVDRSFQLIDSPLFEFVFIKYTPTQSGYGMKIHHLISDGYTVYLLFDEINRVFQALMESKPVSDEENPPYLHYLDQEKLYLASPKAKEDKDFWHRYLLPPPPEMDLSFRKTHSLNFRTQALRILTPETLSADIFQFSQGRSTSVFKFLMAALSIYIWRVTSLDDFVIGSINHGRPSPHTKKIPGLFVDFFPFRINIDPGLSFTDFLDKMGKDLNHIVKNHIKYPYTILASELRAIAGIDTRYFGNLQLIDHPFFKNEDYSFMHHCASHDPNPLNIHVNYLLNLKASPVIEFECQFNTARYDENDIARIIRGLTAAALDALRDPSKPLSNIEILTPEDKESILHTFNDTAAPFPEEKTLDRLFEEQVSRTPQNLAVRAANNPVNLTYDQLNRKANALARKLRQRGTHPNRIAAVMAERSIELITGILAVLKAGGAYMAVSSTFPDKRIDFMCNDTDAVLILSDGTRTLPHKAPITILLDDENQYDADSSNLDPIHSPIDALAVFYTSGSTGRPKGTILEHRGIVNRLWWMQTVYPFKPTDIILQKTPLIFDVSMWELFSWFLCGASVYFMAPIEGEKPSEIVEAVKKSGATHIHIPPAFQLPILHYLESTGQAKEMARVKRVFASGEALLPVHVDTFNSILFKTNATRLYNLYGPTEASIEVSCFDCTADQPIPVVPIGKPIHNMHLLVVDDNMHLVPVGVTGQLCIAGIGVARGYLNRPELTHDVFMKNPYEPDERMYLTGDLARWLPDGNIEFLGRIDQQIQLSGIRIELGEIESHLLKHPHIKEAAVVASEDEKNRKPFLCAYVVGNKDLGTSDYKETLAREIPHFMVPSRFIHLDRMPMTPTGKIDRKTLTKIVPNTHADRLNYLDDLLGQTSSPTSTPAVSPWGTAPSADDILIESEIILSEEEKNRVLYQFNDTSAEYPKGKTIVQLFLDQVERTPDRHAVCGASIKNSPPGSYNTVSLSYRDFNRSVHHLARYLKNRGVCRHTIVAIMVPRSVEMIAGMLAIMEAGGAYMAFSQTDPTKRVAFMCSDTQTPFLLADKNSLSIDAADLPAEIIDISTALDFDLQDTHAHDNEKEDDFDKDIDTDIDLPTVNESEPRDAAGIFYTSGSTGTPKGVIVEHEGLVNRMHWMGRHYPIDETDVILQKTAVIFDVSIWELSWWFFYGASVYVLPPHQGDRPQDIVDAVKNGGVTQLHFIPTPLNAFIHYVEETDRVKDLASLKRVFSSGEALPPLLVNRFNALLYHANHTRLYNLYGPTEASIDVSYFDCPADTPVDIVPIGKPIDNVHLYIIGKNLELLPVGRAGQLCISGIALARGYLNRPELTHEIFKKNPYEPGERLYMTGDMARWMPDGNIEFLGRIDKQVQISGLRIELGEIESALAKHPVIKEAVVVPRIGTNGEPYLCAFITAAHNLDKSDFRQVIARQLPHYMIPSRFIELEKIPFTPSGKANRKALETIDLESQTETAVQYVAPNTEIETRIAEIWKEILNTDKVGIYDNFFDIGGNSLGIIQVNLKLKEVFHRDIPALIMFEYPTISSLVKYLEQEAAASPASAAGTGLSAAETAAPASQTDRAEARTRGRDRMMQRKTRSRGRSGIDSDTENESESQNENDSPGNDDEH